MTYSISILRPAGNDTALVQAKPADKQFKSRLNRSIMSLFPQVEQVGFYYQAQDKYYLEMAGDEFCGNAARSATFLFLKGNPGSLTLTFPNLNLTLKTGIKKLNTAWTQIPFDTSLAIYNQKEYQIANIYGIKQILVPLTSPKQDFKTKAKTILSQLNFLQTLPASGVIFYRLSAQAAEIVPVIWVRDIQTFFVETACASGSAALGLMLSNQTPSIISFPVKQPSQQYLYVSCKTQKSLSIDGPIQFITSQSLTF